MIKSILLLLALEEVNETESPFLFNMVNDLFAEHFLPIKAYDDKGSCRALFVWDNEKELLHGPFETRETGEAKAKPLVIEDYKWAGGELYIYFRGESRVDGCVTGLLTGEEDKVEFEIV